MSVHNIRSETFIPGQDVYVGRFVPSLWRQYRIREEECHFGNPFTLQYESDRDDVLQMFETYTRGRLTSDPMYRVLVEGLYGRRLFCWCAPKRCHADILEDLANHLHHGWVPE